MDNNAHERTESHHLAELVSAAARRWPDAIAVATSRRTLTFAEVDRFADRVAAMLRGQGAAADAPVGICMRRGWPQVVAALGVHRAGAAYLPLDPDLPNQRLASLIRLTGCSHVLAEPGVVVPPGSSVYRIAEDKLAELATLTAFPPAGGGTAPDPDDLAYVLFTSGSTGVPKGVMVPHASAANTITDLNRRFGVGPGDAMLGVSSFSFDPSVYDVFGVLAAGATLVLPDPALARDPAHWADLMDRHKVTLWISVPSLLEMLLAWCEESGFRPALRVALLGGEAFPTSLPERLRRLSAHVRLANVYGPTETSICSTCYVVERVDPAWVRVPCGRPLTGQGVLIRDPELRPVPRGEVGEICVTGRGLARGYWGDALRTAAVFVTDPSSGVRMYRTGDIGRLLPDGNLEFLGRRDEQVKVHGYRIELGEIEAALRASGPIEAAVVVPTGSATAGYDGLAGFVVARNEVDRATLLARLRTMLPGYMVPTTLTRIAAVPLTANGKVDRGALAARAGIAATGAGEAPWPGIEQTIAEALARLLDRSTVGRTEQFWDLGGNSLVAAQLVGRLRRLFQVDIPIGFALEHQSVAAMAQALAELTGARDEPTLARSHGAHAPAHLSHGQEQVWFLDKLVGGNRAYHAQCTIRFSGWLDVDLLRRALTEVVRRHEILRTTFHDSDDGPVQVVHDAAPVDLPVVELGALQDAREAELEAWVRREADRRFDLARGPLVVWRLIRAADDDWLLIQTEHHLVHDGWSVAVLWREVEQLYRAWSDGQDAALPDLPIQFRDLAAWQRQRYSGVQRDRALRYWRRQLDGVGPIDLAVALPRPPRQTFAGAALRVEVPAALYQEMRNFSRDESGSLFVTMFAAFALLMHRYSDVDDLAIGSWLANRDREETDNLIGMLVNMVAMRSTVTPALSFQQMVAQVRQTLYGALAHQYAPFDDVVRALGVPRDPSRNPLVQVCFSFHDSPVPDFDWPGVRGVFKERHNGSAKFDLNVVVVPRAEQRRNLVGPLRADERLTLIWEYNTDLFTAETASRMLAHYLRLLAACCAHPLLPLPDLSMLTGAERVPVPALSDALYDPTPLLDAGNVVAMFRAQLDRDPGAIAVQAADGVCSYEQLDEASRGIAEALTRRGVRPGDRVAVCLRRGVSLPVALLGTLRAGAVYVPLDPQHPARRNSFVATDAEARVVITEPDLASVFPDHEVLHPAGERASSPAQAEAEPSLTGPAYLLYTSGTTGRPKGVLVGHRSLANVLQGMQHLIQLGPADVWLAVTTAAFDIAALELFLPLAVGARVVIAPEDTVVNGERLAALAERCQATVMQATPMTWRILVEVGWRPNGRFTALCGGEAFPSDLAHALAQRSDACWNLYGPTETTIWSMAYRVRGDEVQVPIGRPLLNTTMAIRDRHGAPVAVGLPGELYLGGDGLALGYTSAELTAQRFRDGCYRTGDVVRRRPDGEVEFLHRADRQIKRHGYRIELEEIEQVLRDDASVGDCAVELSEDRLVAYAVRRDERPDTGALLARLSDHLPRYMIPSDVVWLDALPRTANGKLDRAALPAPAPEVSTLDSPAAQEPSGPVEQQLAGVWAEVLGRERISPADDFFAIGGHSLLAVLLVARIQARMSRELALEAVFDHPTLRGMADVLTRSGAS